MVNYYSNANDFLCSNIERVVVFSESLTKKETGLHLYGYCIDSTKIYKNQDITKSEFDDLLEQNIEVCGIFSAVKFDNKVIELVLDPLCQFNIFYYSNGQDFVLSSSLLAIREFLSIDSVCTSFLYDQIAYQSPMRGLTILKDVYYIQFDDLENSSDSRSEFQVLDSCISVKINRPKYDFYSRLTYNDLLDLYVKRLNKKAQIVATHFDCVHIQLTGGADSRLAFSSFSQYDNVECYVYGGGDSQNRLIFEEITRAKNVRSASSIRFVGQPLNNIARISKSLNDSNFFKFNNLNTCMNGVIDESKTYCKITGYYGANISGGVVLPPHNTSLNQRLNKIPEDLFTYHDYVSSFKFRHRNLRPASFNDRFYINNRGKSHYGAHSIADNKYVNAVDILYDYINILLVERCPYSDSDIDRNAITIDLICLNDKQLALFPYDNRRVPKYRYFDDIPLINCFDGYEFQTRDVNEFEVVRPVVDTEKFQFLDSGNSFMSNKQILNFCKVFDSAEKYGHLRYLCDEDGIQSNIFLYFLLSKIFLDLK
ncbi:hypothetical protein ACEUBL_05495 [Aeromonas veronii]